MNQIESTFIQCDVREHYSVENVVGTGTYSTVSRCTHKFSGEEFAVKVISKKLFQETKQSFENEISILKAVNHNNIIKLYEVYETPENIYMVMELIRGGELYTEISENGAISESKAYSIFIQLFEAVKHLHSKNIAHRDIKLENILIDSHHHRVKLSDFGLSKLLPSDEELMRTRCGTPCYVAPEILMGDTYTNAIDIWSLGVILYVMVFSTYPFNNTSMYSMYEAIIAGKLEFPTAISNDLQDLLKGLMKVNLKDRLTIDQIENHPWMKSQEENNNKAGSPNEVELLFRELTLSSSFELQSVSA